MFFSSKILFESGLTMHHERFNDLMLKIYSSATYGSKSNEDNNNGISFDVIKRGPLWVLIIGLIVACISFLYEIINLKKQSKSKTSRTNRKIETENEESKETESETKENEKTKNKVQKQTVKVIIENINSLIEPLPNHEKYKNQMNQLNQ